MGHPPVDDVTEQLQPLLNALEGLSQGVALKPVVVLVLPLRKQTAAVTRSVPLPPGAQEGSRGGTGAGKESQKVQHLPAVHGLHPAVLLIDPHDEVQPAVVLLFLFVCQP